MANDNHLAPYQWKKGVSGNPGGKPKDMNIYRDALVKRVSMDDWAKIVDKAIQQAIKGDVKARDFLADRILGKSAQFNFTESDNKITFSVEYNQKPKQIIDVDEIPDQPADTAS